MDDSSILTRLSSQAALRRRGGGREPPDNPPGARPGENARGLDPLPALEELLPLPKPGDDYEAYPRSSSQNYPTLYFVLANGQVRAFPWSERIEGPDLVPAESPGGGLVIVMRFAGFKPTEVRVSGRNIDWLHVLLGDERVRWVRELPPSRDFKAQNVPVVTGIAFNPLER